MVTNVRIFFGLLLLLSGAYLVCADEYSTGDETNDLLNLNRTFHTQNKQLQNMLQKISESGGLPTQISASIPKSHFSETSLGAFLATDQAGKMLVRGNEFLRGFGQEGRGGLSVEAVVGFADSHQAWFRALGKNIRECREFSDLSLEPEKNQLAYETATTIRYAAGLCVMSALAAMTHGDDEGALLALNDIYKLADLLQEQGSISVVSLYIRGLALLVIQEGCKAEPVRLSFLNGCCSLLESRATDSGELAKQFVVNRAFGLTNFEMIRKEGLDAIGLPNIPDYNLDADEIYYIAFMNDVITCAGKAYFESKATREALRSRRFPEGEYVISRSLMPVFPNRDFDEYARERREALATLVVVSKLLGRHPVGKKEDPMTGNSLFIKEVSGELIVEVNSQDGKLQEDVLRIVSGSSVIRYDRSAD